jgi:C4-type Zn-finger protein
MSNKEAEPTPIECPRCHEHTLICTSSFYPGSGVDHMEYFHTCKNCGFKQSDIEQHGDCGDNEWNCPMCGRKATN